MKVKGFEVIMPHSGAVSRAIVVRIMGREFEHYSPTDYVFVIEDVNGRYRGSFVLDLMDDDPEW